MLPNLLCGLIGRSRGRALVAVILGVLVGLGLHRAGVPWWVHVPAALVASAVFFMLIVALLYSYAKRSSAQRAAEIRQRMLGSQSASGAGQGRQPAAGPGRAPGDRGPTA